MSPWRWLLLGVLAYWATVVALRSSGRLPESVRVYGPLTTLHTRRGRVLLDRLARPKRLWRAWGNLGLGIFLVVMVGMVIVVVLQGLLVLLDPPETTTAAQQPQNFLVIPGVNEFLPLSVAPEVVLGLAVGLIVHEGGHGILCRVEDIEVESLGLVFLAVIPLGAFVEPDEETASRAARGSRSRMFAAGVTNNFLVTVLAFGLLFGPVAGSIAVADGAAVAGAFPGSPADAAGVDRGDRILAVAGEPVRSNDDLEAVLERVPDRTVPVRTQSGTTTVERSLLVVGQFGASPFADGVDVNDTLTAVNGTAVHTEAGLARALAERPVATLQTADGGVATGPAGALVSVSEGYPLAAAGAEPGAELVVTAIDGRRTASAQSLDEVLADTDAGETVPVVAYRDGERRRYEVTLDDAGDGSGFLGVQVFPGVSGLSVSGFGTELFPAETYLALFGGDAAGRLGFGGGGPLGGVRSAALGVFVALLLPLAAFGLPGLGFNFPGIEGWQASFFVAQGPLAGLGDGVILAANALFWIGWVNLNLGVFNCVPTFMLDGGHVFRTATESVVARLPVADGRRLVTALTVTVQFVLLGGLFLMIFGAQLLS